MCGFVGFTGMIDAREAVLQRMMDRIVHRGPDMGGRYLDDGVALGFRRLSILDLSEAGAQPMSSEDGGVTVVFNGEIYNFMELRKELETLGHRFHCGADTEVLVHGYEEWGDGLVYRLRGMYGFVIWDKLRGRLFGARDIFGIKPFYYYPIPGGEGLLFGSEIKSFLDHPKFRKAVNENALRPYLTLQYSPRTRRSSRVCTSCPRRTALCTRTAVWTSAAIGTVNLRTARAISRPAPTSWTRRCTSRWRRTASPT